MECVFRVSLQSGSYALRNGFETGSEGRERQRRSRRILPYLEGSDRKRRVGDSRRGTPEHSYTVLADFHTALLGRGGVMLRRLAQDFVRGFRESTRASSPSRGVTARVPSSSLDSATVSKNIE
ncbi:hypothetical protein NPIL_240031 [Nephila pilipes]|uniref:Uncharacterized protein n=1 Tax=Nephila pilipes TaxID=299642 RepID=A0A8X6U974_NEPPI|nr:hypothetical protein NPIL_240031 [Nephila pilipes]